MNERLSTQIIPLADDQRLTPTGTTKSRDAEELRQLESSEHARERRLVPSWWIISLLIPSTAILCWAMVSALSS